MSARPRVLLPNEFVFAHNLCFRFHDEMVDMLLTGEREDLFSTQFEMTPDEAEDFKRTPDEKIFTWLEQQRKNEVITEILMRTIFPALLSDFCLFLFEALSCSRKEKLAVAFALLRKPLRENLLYLEWLLAEPEELLTRFYSQPIAELAFEKLAKPDVTRQIIEKTIAKTKHPQSHSAEYLFDLRFNKRMLYSFAPYWDRALHIVTTRGPIATEEQNLNFIFASQEDHLWQWRHLYGQLPRVLYYAVDVVDALMRRVSGSDPDTDEREVPLQLGMLLWTHSFGDMFDDPGTTEEIRRTWEGRFSCPRCGAKMPAETKWMARLYDGKRARCPACRKKFAIGGLK